MSLLRKLKARRRNVIRAMQLRYAAYATWIPAIYPDFMCIGAPRAATTWLHKKLRSDPRIFLPKAKELHFFSEPNDLDYDDRSGLSWHRSFYFDMSNPVHFRWYSMQFRKGANLTKGEITPDYAMLSPERVRLIIDTIPDLKVIYIIRNPIDRAWSGLRKSVWYQMGANHRVLKDRDWLLSTIMHPGVLERGNYRKAIATWGGLVNERNILYLFYDDIVEDQQLELARVYSFLHLDRPHEGQPNKREKRVNAAPALRMPEEVQSKLAQHYREQIRYLESRFNRDLGHWTTGGAQSL